MAKIERLIGEAKDKKASVERIVDRMAKYLVLAIFLLAAIIYFVTSDAERAITVLIVACPCALFLVPPQQ